MPASKNKPPSTCFFVEEENPAQRQLFSNAVIEGGFSTELFFFNTGDALCEHLKANSRFNPESSDYRNTARLLIFLNLHTEKNSLAPLIELRSDAHLKRVPVIAMAEKYDSLAFEQAYDLGVSSCLIKPTEKNAHIRTLQIIHDYWLSSVDIIRFEYPYIIASKHRKTNPNPSGHRL